MKISRLNALEQYILTQKTVTIDDLCQVFDVSKNTIRRDLNELEARGQICKVYGGVTANTVVSVPLRTSASPTDKNTIGQLAASEVRDGDTIFVDAGTTALCLLQYLSSRRRVTVVTHALSVMRETARYENLNLISLGGVYAPASDSFVGLSAYETLSSMRLNKAFMATNGVSIEHGITHNTFLEAEMKKGAVQHAQQVYVMADCSKMDKSGTISYAPFSQITALITERRPAEKFVKYAQTHGVRLVFPKSL